MTRTELCGHSDHIVKTLVKVGMCAIVIGAEINIYSDDVQVLLFLVGSWGQQRPEEVGRSSGCT